MPASQHLETLARLAVKQGVGLGGLTDGQRMGALALAWSVLPWGPMNERAVNESLKAALTGAARSLDTDHVELRRWLVDTGWVTRDGFGREYRRVVADRLRAEAQPWVDALNGLDVALWVAEQCALQQARRAQRRQAWEGAAGPA
jgi:hypothetical protein